MHLAKDLSDVLEDTIHDVWGHWVFGAIQHHPLSPGDSSLCPTALLPTNLVLLIHSHLVTFSGVSVANLIVLTFTALVMPSSVSTDSSQPTVWGLAVSSPALNHPELFHPLLGLGPPPLFGLVHALFQGEPMRSRMINRLVVEQLG